MNNELEKFVRVNRDAFDTETPPERVWKTLEKKFVKQQAEKAVFYRSIILKISAAAAVVLAACLTTWYFTVTSLDSRDKTLAANTKITNPTGTPGPKAGKQPIPGDSVTAVTAGDKKKNNSGDEAADNNYNQELYYYAKLSEIKFNQLKKLTTDEPELYKSFAGEIKKLDSTYHNLQKMLAGNADKEAVLNAMLQNLKMQTEILNRQLNIIHTIKQSKNNKNENNDQSI